KVGTNAFDHAGAEVLLDTFQCGGGHDTELRRLELEAMRPVGHPPARAVDIFPWGDGGSGPHHRDEVPMAAHLHPEDAEARLFAVKGDAFYTARKVFYRRVTCWRWGQQRHSRVLA